MMGTTFIYPFQATALLAYMVGVIDMIGKDQIAGEASRGTPWKVTLSAHWYLQS